MTVRRTGHPLFTTTDGVTIADVSQTHTGDVTDPEPLVVGGSGSGVDPEDFTDDQLAIWDDAQQKLVGVTPDPVTAADVPFVPAGTIAATNVQAAIEEVAAEASGGGGTVEPERIPGAPEVVPGRTVYADFSDATQIAGLFDLGGTNVPTLTTDPVGGRAALTVVSNNQAGTILAKPEYSFRNAEVYLRYRVTANPHIVTSIRSIHRYASATQYTYASRGFAGQSGGGFGFVGNGQSAAAVGSGLFNADAGATIHQKSRIIDNLFQYKVWAEGTVEPDWTAQNVASGGNFSQEVGRLGARLSILDADVYLTEMIITELLPASDNMVFNSDLSLLAIPGGTPLGYTTGGAPVGNTNEIVSIPDASGVTRRFIHIAKTVESESGGVTTFQIRKRANAYDGRVRGGLGRTSPWFDAKAVEIGVTSKATNIRHGGVATFLGAGVILYYGRATGPDPSNDVSGMVGLYYKALGPNRLSSDGTLAQNGQDGCGTWGWRRDKLRIELQPNTSYINVFVGLHDGDILGDLWIGDITMRPVA